MKVSGNFKNGKNLENGKKWKILRQQTFIVGNNFCQHSLFVGKYFSHLTKNLSFFTNKVFTNKVEVIS